MSVPPELAAKILTAKQFIAWNLHVNRNVSYRSIGLMLGVDRSTIRDRVKRAEQRLELAQIEERKAA